jgi:hypothetical protein
MPKGIYKHISSGMKGKHHSKQTKKKLSGMNAGSMHPMYGKQMSVETKEKISKKRLGFKFTKESIEKMKQSHKGLLAGEKHPNWRGGISRAYKTGYYSLKYKEWRISVFERDHYTCMCCGKVGGYLTAHHIKSFAHYPELRFSLSNGVALCEDCHKLTDNYRGKCSLKKKLK